jgi:hypothetical protein
VVRSSLGMADTFTTELRTLGGTTHALPAIGPWSIHGRHLATTVLLAVGLLGVALGTWRRGRRLWRFRAFRPGAPCPLGTGSLEIGAGGAAGAALVLPNSGSALDDTPLGRVTQDAKGQILQDVSGGLLRHGDRPFATPQRLAPGALVGIVDPDDEDERLWEIEYFDFDSAEGGEVEVVTTPVRETAAGIAGKLLLGLGVLALLRWALASGWFAALAYGLSPVELLYLALFTP